MAKSASHRRTAPAGIAAAEFVACELGASLDVMGMRLAEGSLSKDAAQIVFDAIVTGRDALAAGDLPVARKWSRFAMLGVIDSGSMPATGGAA